jgi:hypothetical protein
MRRSSAGRAASVVLGVALLAGACTASGDPAPGDPAPGNPAPGGASVPSSGPGSTGTASTGTAPTVDPSDAAGILARARERAASARSGRFTGTIREGGEQATVEFGGTRDGSSVDVTKSAPRAGTVRLISVGGSVYVKADETFWSSQNVPFIVSLAGDRFVTVPAGVVPVLDELTLASFVDRSIGTFPAGQLSPAVGEETIDGVACWVLTTSTGSAADGALYVSKDTFDVVRWVGTADQPGRLDFSRWGEDLGVTPPSGDQVFSIG